LVVYSNDTDLEACVGDDFSLEVFLDGGWGEYHTEWYLNDVLYSDTMNFKVPTLALAEYNFELKASDECSNEVRQDFMIDVVECLRPNVFTPNDDGENDYWYVNFGDVVGNVRVDIYNRWGQLVYNATHYELCDELTGSHCWDGTDMFTKELCSEGVYFYTIELLDGRKERGYFSLFR